MISAEKIKFQFSSEELLRLFVVRALQAMQAELSTVELQWLENLWNHENMFDTGAVRANECKS